MQSLKFSTEVKCSDLYSLMAKNYMFSITDYYELQRVWLHNAYISFKDLDKYFILMTLVSKTFDSYKEYFIKYNWDDFYNQNEYELKKVFLNVRSLLNKARRNRSNSKEVEIDYCYIQKEMQCRQEEKNKRKK